MADALLTEDELQGLSDLFGMARPSTCVVLRRQAGRDVGGAPVLGPWNPVATVSCRVESRQNAPVEDVFGGRVTPETDYRVALPKGTDVTTEDRIAVNGATLEVSGVPGVESYIAELVVSAKAVR